MSLVVFVVDDDVFRQMRRRASLEDVEGTLERTLWSFGVFSAAVPLQIDRNRRRRRRRCCRLRLSDA